MAAAEAAADASRAAGTRQRCAAIPPPPLIGFSSRRSASLAAIRAPAAEQPLQSFQPRDDLLDRIGDIAHLGRQARSCPGASATASSARQILRGPWRGSTRLPAASGCGS